jgi:hypothetical protein
MQESNEMMIYFDLFLAITSSGIVYSVAGSCQYCFCKLIPPCWRLVPNFTTSSNQKSVFPYIPVWLNLCPTSRPTSIPRHWRCRREHRCQSPSPLLRAFSSSPFGKISAYGSTVQSKRLLCGSVLPGHNKSSRPQFSKNTATLRHLTAKILIYTACFLEFHGHHSTNFPWFLFCFNGTWASKFNGVKR